MSTLHVHRVLHAGYILSDTKTRLLFDPIFENPFSVNCYAFPEVRFDIDKITKLSVDAIFISHYHEDHCSFESLNLLPKTTPVFMFCQHLEMFDLLKQLGFENVYPIALEETIRIGDFQVIAHRALDADVDCIYEIQLGNLKVLNVVDSWIDEETFAHLKTKSWDLILWPFQTMRELEVLNPSSEVFQEPAVPEEWLEQIKALNPKFLVPSSCQFQMEPGSWYNSVFFPISYKFFSEQIKEILQDLNIYNLKPGLGIELKKIGPKLESKNIARLDWVLPIGNQDVDYSFNPNKKIPETKDLVSNFRALTALEETAVKNFLESEILLRFQELDPDLCPYFYKVRGWRLDVYFEKVRQKSYFFKVQNNEISFLDQTQNEIEISWYTEIIAVKLWGALNKGESLTSLYARIKPSSKISELSDLLQDPLLRVLYEGRFASYQKAQLNRLGQEKLFDKA